MHSIQEEMHKYDVESTAFPFSTRIQLKTLFDMLLPPSTDTVKLSRQQLIKVVEGIDYPGAPPNFERPQSHDVAADLMGDKNGISFEDFQKRVDRIHTFSEGTRFFLGSIGMSPLWWRQPSNFGPAILSLDQIESKYDSQLRNLNILKENHLPLVTDLLHNIMRWTRKIKSDNKNEVLRLFRTLEQICSKCYEQNLVSTYVEASKALMEFIRRYGKVIPNRLLTLLMGKAMISPKLAIGNFCMNAATTMLRVFCKYASDKDYQIVDHLQSVFTNIMRNDAKKAELPIWAMKFVIKKYVYNCPPSSQTRDVFWKKMSALFADGYQSKHTNVRRWAEVAYAYAKQYNLHKNLVPNESTQKKIAKNIKASKKGRNDEWNIEKLASWDEVDVWKTSFGSRLHRKKPKGLTPGADPSADDRESGGKGGKKGKKKRKKRKGHKSNQNSFDSEMDDIIQQDIRLNRDSSNNAFLDRQWSFKSEKTGYTEMMRRQLRELDGKSRRSAFDIMSKAGDMNDVDGLLGGESIAETSTLKLPTTDEELVQDNLRKNEEMAALEKLGPKTEDEKEIDELTDLARKKYFRLNNSIFNDPKNPYVEHVRRQLGESKSVLEYDNEDLIDFIESLQLAFLDRKHLIRYFPRWINGYMFLNFIRFDKEIVRRNILASRVYNVDKKQKYYDDIDYYEYDSDINNMNNNNNDHNNKSKKRGSSGRGGKVEDEEEYDDDEDVNEMGIVINLNGKRSRNSKSMLRYNNRQEEEFDNDSDMGNDFDCYDWSDEFFQGIWTACLHFWDQYLIELGVAKIGEAAAESMALSKEQARLSAVLQENDVEYNETIGNDYINHIVIGPEVAKVIAEEDRLHPRWTFENRNELISAKLSLEKARSDFEKEFTNMPILTHAIHEMYKDLHLLVHTIDKETKKLKLLATELTTQQLCLKDLEVKQKHLIKEKEQLLTEYGRAVKEKHEMMRTLEINGKMDYVKHLESLKDEITRQSNEATEYDLMLEYAWNTEAKWMDLIITLLDVFKRGKLEELQRRDDNGDDLMEMNDEIHDVNQQTPMTPMTPFSDAKSIFPATPHQIPPTNLQNEFNSDLALLQQQGQNGQSIPANGVANGIANMGGSGVASVTSAQTGVTNMSHIRMTGNGLNGDDSNNMNNASQHVATHTIDTLGDLTVNLENMGTSMYGGIQQMTDSEVYDILDGYCRFYLCGNSENRNNQRYSFWDNFITHEWFKEYSVIDRWDDLTKKRKEEKERAEFERNEENDGQGFRHNLLGDHENREKREKEERERKEEKEIDFIHEMAKQRDVENSDLYIPIELMRLREYVKILHTKEKLEDERKRKEKLRAKENLEREKLREQRRERHRDALGNHSFHSSNDNSMIGALNDTSKDLNIRTERKYDDREFDMNGNDNLPIYEEDDVFIENAGAAAIDSMQKRGLNLEKRNTGVQRNRHTGGVSIVFTKSLYSDNTNANGIAIGNGNVNGNGNENDSKNDNGTENGNDRRGRARERDSPTKGTNINAMPAIRETNENDQRQSSVSPSAASRLDSLLNQNQRQNDRSRSSRRERRSRNNLRNFKPSTAQREADADR